MSVLAIDAGTTGVTALVVAPDGSVVARGHRGLPQHCPRPGWAEHDAEEIWRATRGAVDDVVRERGADDLTAVGIASQRETVVLWDRETLASPRRAIVSQDRRTADICSRMREAGHEERVTELTGLRLDPRFPGTTLVWLAEQEPHTWAHVAEGRYAVGTADSYLVARMTRGTWHVTDVSNASRTLLLDLAAGDWSDELCDLFGVPRDALPELVPSWGQVATTDRSVFAGLALPVTGLAGDQHAALFGQACFEVGTASWTAGSGSSVLVNTGGALVCPDAGQLGTAAWASPAGETTYALEGAVTGAAGDRPGDVASAAEAETLAGEVQAITDAMPPLTRLAVGGDAAGSDLLCQALADQLRIPVDRPRVPEPAGLGAALLAGLGAGVWDSTDDLRHIWRLGRRFEPTGSSVE